MASSVSAVEPLLGGLSFSYQHFLDGEIKADGVTSAHDSGARYGVHFRDYFLRQPRHNPFAEVSLFYETFETETTNFAIDSESIMLNFTVGSAIPCYWMADESVMLGITPEVGLEFGTFEADFKTSDGVTSQKNSDSAYRYGVTAGLGVWMLMNRTFGIGGGIYGAYWGATDMSVISPNGGGFVQRTTAPTGWDVGVRAHLNFMF